MALGKQAKNICTTKNQPLELTKEDTLAYQKVCNVMLCISFCPAPNMVKTYSEVFLCFGRQLDVVEYNGQVKLVCQRYLSHNWTEGRLAHSEQGL